MGVMAAADRDDDVMRLLTAGRDREAARRGAALAQTERPRDHDGGDMDPLAQFEQLGPLLGGVIARLRPADLDAATPCAEFTVRGVLEHMIGGATMFAAAYRGDASAEPDFTDPITGIQAALGELAASITEPGALDRTIQSPFGEADGEWFARYVVLDGLVHGWDLATATDQAYEPPTDLVAAVTDFAEQSLDGLRDGHTFKTAVAPTAVATPIERLAAYTGRTVPRAQR
jgi:uncharacterized protein (TIGR03086 family)